MTAPSRAAMFAGARVALGALLVTGMACSSRGRSAEDPPPSIPTVVAVDTGDAGAKRTLLTGRALPGHPTNLLHDPGFSLVGQQVYGGFIALAGGAFIAIPVEVDSRSPARLAGHVAAMKAPGASNTSSSAVTLVASFLGGDGPFHASVWLSKSDLTGAPTQLTLDSSVIRVTLVDGTPEAGQSFELTPFADEIILEGARVWTPYRGEIARAFDHGGYFIVDQFSGGGQLLVAAPEVTADPLVAAQPKSSRGQTLFALPRPSSRHERDVLSAYRSITPRFDVRQK